MNPSTIALDSSDTKTLSLRESIHDIYNDLGRDVSRAGPICDLSGRCCRFTEWDHTLFLSGIEAHILLTEAPPACRPLDDGLTCPWQDEGGRCTAREARPLGCRVYFCDPSYQETGQDLSETYLGRLKAMADAHDQPWSYAPLHHHLRAAIGRGEWSSPVVESIDPCVLGTIDLTEVAALAHRLTP